MICNISLSKVLDFEGSIPTLIMEHFLCQIQGRGDGCPGIGFPGKGVFEAVHIEEDIMGQIFVVSCHRHHFEQAVTWERSALAVECAGRRFHQPYRGNLVPVVLLDGTLVGRVILCPHHLLKVPREFADIVKRDAEQAGPEDSVDRQPVAGGYAMDQACVNVLEAAPGVVDGCYVSPV
ncbi:MAG TPA: hypothetical protein VFT74_21825 [Isosphaeraceae bacterium]|nr:hypothetical protein [Isosphaeraceae bacterium]